MCGLLGRRFCEGADLGAITLNSRRLHSGGQLVVGGTAGRYFLFAAILRNAFFLAVGGRPSIGTIELDQIV